jgi:hypothetical protein
MPLNVVVGFPMGFRDRPGHRRIREAARAARRLSGEQLDAVRRRVGAAINSRAQQEIRRQSPDLGALGAELQRYARGGGIASTVLNKFGQIGKALEYVLGGLRHPGVSDQAVQDAIELLRRVAPQVTSSFDGGSIAANCPQAVDPDTIMNSNNVCTGVSIIVSCG